MNDLKTSIKINVMKNIPYYRKLNKMTQRELAAKINVKPTTVSTWERGGNLPDIETMIHMCRLFHITLNTMLGVGDTSNDFILRTKEEMDIIIKYRRADNLHKQMVLCALGLEKNTEETVEQRA